MLALQKSAILLADSENIRHFCIAIRKNYYYIIVQFLL